MTGPGRVATESISGDALEISQVAVHIDELDGFPSSRIRGPPEASNEAADTGKENRACGKQYAPVFWHLEAGVRRGT